MIISLVDVKTPVYRFVLCDRDVISAIKLQYLLERLEGLENQFVEYKTDKIMIVDKLDNVLYEGTSCAMALAAAGAVFGLFE